MIAAFALPVATAAQSYDTIVDAAVATDDLSTLVTAVTAAELVDVLSSEGPFTVFAPVNAAFAALPDGTLDSLLADPSGALTDILTYHVVAGAVLSTDLVEGMVPTLNGANVAVSLDNGVQINDANVVIADIEVGNGVVHVIDSVLLPPQSAPVAMTAPATTSATTYTVRAGDSLSRIAGQFYGNIHAYGIIFEANRSIITNVNLIYPGQVLNIPAQ